MAPNSPPSPTPYPVPRAGRLTVPRVAAVPRRGAIPSPVVVRRRARGSLFVERVVTSVPVAGSLARTETDGPGAGPNEFGHVTVADRVVTKIASRAAADNPDAGAVAARVLGAEIPGLDKIGGRQTSLTSLPKTTGEVDGARAFVAIELSVRYPASVAEVTEAVRRHVIGQVRALTGVETHEVDIKVRALVTDLPAPPRVR